MSNSGLYVVHTLTYVAFKKRCLRILKETQTEIYILNELQSRSDIQDFKIRKQAIKCNDRGPGTCE